MTNGDNTLAALFSRANRPYTIAIIVAVLALAAFLVLDAGSGDHSSSGATSAPPGTVPVALTGDDCTAGAQALASARAGVGGTALDQASIEGAFTRLAEFAPTAIRADLAVMIAAVDDLFGTLDAAGIDLGDPNTMASEDAQTALTRASADFATSGYEDAAARVAAWFEAECAGDAG